ncbi:hypothetical protein AB6A40_009032 [Gnathostoma spinigerum]|uniref:Uncharacterized protein n=1 Tax=Gnathostoma spinigerum TaxID=75299 RepID=A0ABD6ER54_9BILA
MGISRRQCFPSCIVKCDIQMLTVVVLLQIFSSLSLSEWEIPNTLFDLLGPSLEIIGGYPTYIDTILSNESKKTSVEIVPPLAEQNTDEAINVPELRCHFNGFSSSECRNVYPFVEICDRRNKLVNKPTFSGGDDFHICQPFNATAISGNNGVDVNISNGYLTGDRIITDGSIQLLVPAPNNECSLQSRLSPQFRVNTTVGCLHSHSSNERCPNVSSLVALLLTQTEATKVCSNPDDKKCSVDIALSDSTPTVTNDDQFSLQLIIAMTVRDHSIYAVHLMLEENANRCTLPFVVLRTSIQFRYEPVNIHLSRFLKLKMSNFAMLPFDTLYSSVKIQ